MIGIYKIENLINGRCYIGQSINIKKRWAAEKRVAYDLTTKEYNYPISRAFRKYGLENFSFKIIEECLQSELNQKEKYWINYYNSFYDGYNQTFGGDKNNSNIPKEKIIGIINDLKNTQLYHKEIAKKWNISIEMVQGINTGRYWYSDYENYPLQKKKQSKIWYCKDCGKIISKGAERCVECYNLFNRKVQRPTKEELYNYLKEIKGNFSQASRKYGVSDNAVRKWCIKYGIPHKSKDYKIYTKIINDKSSNIKTAKSE